jgi:hypothetical protein
MCASAPTAAGGNMHSTDTQQTPWPTKIGDITMLESIAIVLLILWALGLVSAYTLGGFIHVLLVLAIVVILIRVIQGRRI